jgi:hypothetical protein
MDVRTNEPHRFAESVATDPANQFRFNVEPLPKIDHAAVALKQAQERYLREFPDADLTDLIWTITLVDADGEPLPDREAGVFYVSTDANEHVQREACCGEGEGPAV